MAQVKAVFFIPITDNDGRDLTVEKDDLETAMFFQFLGWTFLGFVKGAYQMTDGSRAVDEHRAYAIIMDESRLPDVEKALRDFLAKTKQEAIYLEVQYNVEMRLIRPQGDPP
jgi:hypothetical protein